MLNGASYVQVSLPRRNSEFPNNSNRQLSVVFCWGGARARWGGNIYKINYVCGICTFIRLHKTTQHCVVVFCFLVKLGLNT